MAVPNERTATRPVLLSEAGRGIRLKNATHNNKTTNYVSCLPQHEHELQSEDITSQLIV